MASPVGGKTVPPVDPPHRTGEKLFDRGQNALQLRGKFRVKRHVNLLQEHCIQDMGVYSRMKNPGQVKSLGKRYWPSSKN
jgi:hypothetical protein